MKLTSILKMSLPAVMLLSLAACGGKDNSSPAASHATPQQMVDEAINVARFPIAGTREQVTDSLTLAGRVTVTYTEEEDRDVFITWASETAGQWEFTEPSGEDGVVYANPVFTDQVQQYKLIGTATYEGATAKCEITGTIVAKDVGKYASKQVKDLPTCLETEVSVEGYAVILGSLTGKGFYLVDNTGSTYVYYASTDLIKTGMKVRVEGLNTTFTSDYAKIRQINASTGDGNVSILDSNISALPFAGAKATSIEDAIKLTPANATEADYRTLYEVTGALTVYVNSYGNPTIEIVPSPTVTSPYLGFYPASAGVETKYADIFGSFTYTSAGVVTPAAGSKINDGNIYKVYCTIYDVNINSSGTQKLRWVPIAAIPA